MITGNENLLQIAELNKEFISVFEQHGLGNYFKEENLNKTGRFIRLSTLLSSNNINTEYFIEKLNQSLTEKKEIEKNENETLHFSAMLPCGLRNPFKELTESYIEENKDLFKDLNYMMEGNVNHELSYYPLLDNITDENELPDVIMASDVNNFFHRPFIHRFIENDVFEAVEPYVPNKYLQKAGYADPKKNYTMYTANMLVMVVDKKKLGDREIPQKWSDILNPSFENSIIMRGEDDFFCNAVMLPFYKDHGFDAIKILAQNIKSGMHPAEMVKLAGKDDEKGAAIYIMPYFFAKRIKSADSEIIWPEDGAIASPVFLLVKKNKKEQHKELINYLFSKELAELLKQRYFPAIHPEIDHKDFPETVKWLGWDFLNDHYIGKLKEDIQDVFMEVWNKK